MAEQPILRQSGIRNVAFGRQVVVVEPANLYECEIGDHCFIGPFTEIQSDVRIGAHTRIQSHAFICSLVTIGTHCFVGHGVQFVNDDFRRGGPAGGDASLYRRTEIGNHVSLGTNATILPVRIADGVVVGAGAVVTRDLDVKGIYAGNPARLLRPL
ncbi:MAG: N-acetyltransferase [Verrucomicrobiota bacterium]|jgi:acetyltransferase-like isoleucine patch superfamily enzyme|nr:N-acetyltransferase [Verrucomicrobiota bacterium]